MSLQVKGAAAQTTLDISGITIDVEVYQAPTPILSETIATKLSELASLRFQKETGGITVAGVSIRTDRESQATLTGAYVAVQLNADLLIDWKCADETWTQIDKATVLFLSAAVANHVQLCFSNEKAHSIAIQALLSVEAVEAYDITTGWLS